MQTVEYDVVVPSEMNWELVQNGGHFKVYANDYLIYVQYYTSSYSYTVLNSDTQIGTLQIDTKYCPPAQLINESNQVKLKIGIFNNGGFFYRNVGTAMSSTSVLATFIYPRKSALP